jgi:S-adenosylmethionine:tRNA ribosyltransferase-isomerase
MSLRTDDLDFHLPPELIAQEPPSEREGSRLLHYRRDDRSVAHRRFADLPKILRPGDLLVFNDAQVLPARFTLLKSTGGRVEGLFLEELRPGHWRVLLKNLGPTKGSAAAALRFAAAPEVVVTVVARGEEGEYGIELASNEPAAGLLSRVGRMPLPPYIKRGKEHDERDDLDRVRYQTVFARAAGAVAAPTAALHFSEALLGEFDAAGVERAFVTLHVGMGTFKPVTVEDLNDHRMHAEAYSIDAEAADALNRAKSEGRRVVAVGTTSARVLESQPAGEPFAAKTGETRIFIYPPYEWKHVEAMVTNFHLPRSTLIALVAALVGLDEQRKLYQIAIEDRYRFFSYGDAMFVE